MHEIALHNISYAYGSQKILDNISFTAAAGEFVCLLGPSGCGKSTLLRLLAGLAQPSAGSLTLDGRRISGPGLDRGVVFQDYGLFPWMTAGQNVVLALEQAFPGRSKADQRETAQEYLEMVGLGTVFNKLPSALSGGMRQRAAIARAFAINSPVLLMDEPFGASMPSPVPTCRTCCSSSGSRMLQSEKQSFLSLTMLKRPSCLPAGWSSWDSIRVRSGECSRSTSPGRASARSSSAVQRSWRCGIA